MDDLISRQAAIDEIDEWIKAFRENGHKESSADACLIQDGIIQLPSVQPEHATCYLDSPCEYQNINIALPSAQPKRKNGRWLQTTKHYKDDEQEYDYIETTCSVCGVKKRIGWTGANYCPNCGSYNGGEQDE